MSIIVPFLAIIGIATILLAIFVWVTLFAPRGVLRFICRATGGHRWRIVDDWHDGKVLRQCKVCGDFSYGAGGVAL